MSTAIISAPLPGGTRRQVTTEPSGVLVKRVAARGLCSPAVLSVTKSTFRVADGDDPWFPVEEIGDRARDLARKACRGCPVMAECLALALREERHLGAGVYGIRGGLSAEDRLALREQSRSAEDGAR